MLKTNIENKAPTAMPLSSDYDPGAEDTGLLAGIDGMIVGDTPFTLAFTQEFIGAEPDWKWPGTAARGPERLKGLMTFAQLLLSGAQKGEVDAGAHPGDLDAKLLTDVSKFLSEYQTIGWPDTAAHQPLVGAANDGSAVRMAEATLLLMRVVRASASTRDGGGNGPVKYPIKPA